MDLEIKLSDKSIAFFIPPSPEDTLLAVSFITQALHFLTQIHVSK